MRASRGEQQPTELSGHQARAKSPGKALAPQMHLGYA